MISKPYDNTAQVEPLSEKSLEQAIKDIEAFTSERGEKLSIIPNRMHIHPDNQDEFEAWLMEYD